MRREFFTLANANETQRSSATLSGMSGRQRGKGTSSWFGVRNGFTIGAEPADAESRRPCREAILSPFTFFIIHHAGASDKGFCCTNYVFLDDSGGDFAFSPFFFAP
ncbi:MAG: hypothetical protein V8R10_10280 [Christensenellales bacterium]